MEEDDDEVKSVSDDLKNYFKDPSLNSKRRQRRYSMGSSYDASDSSLEDEESANWSHRHHSHEQSKDDSYLGYNHSAKGKRHQRPAAKKTRKRSSYNYQICLFIQMQLCHPATLADWIRERNKKYSDQSVADRMDAASQVFRQIASGLSHVHNKGIIHRDLKPANVFASPGEGFNFKLGDFGLSKIVQREARRQTRRMDETSFDSSLLHEGEICVAGEEPSWQDPLTAGVGTASYAAPEQVTSKVYGTKADIFSFGLILLELLCSFSTEHERLQTFQDCRNKRTLPSELDDFPVASKIILACTEPCADKRPTAFELEQTDIQKAIPVSPAQKREREIVQLREELLTKEKEIELYQRQLLDRNREVDRLRRELEEAQSELRKSTSGSRGYVSITIPGGVDVCDSTGSASSDGAISEDEM